MKLIYTADYVVKKVMCRNSFVGGGTENSNYTSSYDFGKSGNSGNNNSSGNIASLMSASAGESSSEKHHQKKFLSGEVMVEVLEEYGYLEQPEAANTASHSTVVRRTSLRRKLLQVGGNGGSAGDAKKHVTGSSRHAASSSQPLFYPSPSGMYCAIVWPESMVYVVMKVNVLSTTTSDSSASSSGSSNTVDAAEALALAALANSQAAAASTMKEVDRGFCLEFGWIGTADHYLVSVLSFIYIYFKILILFQFYADQDSSENCQWWW